MVKYFTLSITLCWLIVHFFSAKVRIEKMKALPGEYPNSDALNNILKMNFYFSLLIVSITAFISISYVYLPSIYSFYFSLGDPGLTLTNYIGAFLIKFSFIWLVIQNMLISKTLQMQEAPVDYLKIYKIEMTGFCGILLLTCGLFVFIPSLVSLLLLSGTIFFIFFSNKKIKRIMTHV